MKETRLSITPLTCLGSLPVPYWDKRATGLRGSDSLLREVLLKSVDPFDLVPAKINLKNFLKMMPGDAVLKIVSEHMPEVFNGSNPCACCSTVLDPQFSSACLLFFHQMLSNVASYEFRFQQQRFQTEYQNP